MDTSHLSSNVFRLRTNVDQKTLELMTLVRLLEDERFGEIAAKRYPSLSPIETLQRLLSDYRDFLGARHAELMQDDEHCAMWLRIWQISRAE